MKKYLMYFLMSVAVLPCMVQAQGKRAICMDRCIEEAINGGRQQAHEAKLKKIQDQKATEKDPEILKQLAEQEEEEQEKYQAAREKVCKRICAAFSE